MCSAIITRFSGTVNIVLPESIGPLPTEAATLHALHCSDRAAFRELEAMSSKAYCYGELVLLRHDNLLTLSLSHSAAASLPPEHMRNRAHRSQTTKLQTGMVNAVSTRPEAFRATPQVLEGNTA